MEPFRDLRLAVVDDFRVCFVDLGYVAGGIGRLISIRAGRCRIVLASGVVALFIGSVRLNTDSDV